jgi:hypothetical protein
MEVVPMGWRREGRYLWPGVGVSLLLLVSWVPGYAQEGLTAKLLAQGGITIMSGGETVAKLSLNAHGPQWSHADQILATAATRNAEEGGKIVEGFLPVPNTDGGAIRFAETLQPTDDGFAVSYKLSFIQAMTLNGLQVSLLLPAKAFAGQGIALHAPQAEAVGEAGDEAPAAAAPTLITLPAQMDGENWQLATAPAGKVEIAPGTPRAITLVPKLPETAEGEGDRLQEAAPGAARKAPFLVVQDLRKWEQDVFEVRLVLVMSEEGQEMAADEVLEAGLELTFASELSWQ